MYEKSTIVKNKTGFHARPASVLVSTAMKFTSAISIETASKKANAKSLISILSLGASKDTEIVIKAEGPDEEEAVAALLELVDSEFKTE